MELDKETFYTLWFGNTWSKATLYWSKRRRYLTIKMQLTRGFERPKSSSCKQCGKIFSQRERGAVRAFCGDTCKSAWHTQQAKKSRNVERLKQCLNCQAFIEQRGDKPRKFCNDKCYKKYSRKLPMGIHKVR